MKKILKTLIILLTIVPFIINADEKELNIYLFYGETCPHCTAEKEFLNEYLKDKENIKLHKYEIWNNEENAKHLKEVGKILGNTQTYIPYLVIGENAIVGFGKGLTEEKIINTIDYYLEVEFEDKVGKYLNITQNNVDTSNDKTEEKEPSEENKNNTLENKNEFDIPLLGKINAKETSLTLLSVVIGLVDGLNPCAMWILIFLISMLLGTKNKKRMWILGITFLTSSALVYFLFMISWLNLASLLNKIVYIRLSISLLAILLGGYQIFRFLFKLAKKKEEGCEIVNPKGRKKIMLSIKKVVTEKSFILALLGIIIIAVSVNIIELLCSLGLPVMFTQILALNDLTTTSKMIYSLIYVLFFLIDDITIFIIAMKTLEIKAVSNKIGKYSHLIGGIIMVLIGFLMLYRPDWLMLNF